MNVHHVLGVFMKKVYEKINGGKKKALEDGEVVIQSSKCGNFDTRYRYLLLGIDTYDTQRQHKAQSMPRASSSVIQVQDHARTAPPPRIGVGFHHSPRLGVARRPMIAPSPCLSVVRAPQ
ncbi:hypothetical protein PIB30_040326 [Stylosanthes scabra]|uniref:Uncharacterized protein n=1 Tax=Stylosanthes scabra TaxID=79078 RepID=A0ABU6SES5_9FABA|nr:hypothetical protein [Stylosanthes scabra]